MARLNQQQVEQWIAQNGGAAAVQYGVERKSVRNPEFDPVTNPLAPQYIDIEVEAWKNPQTGAVLTVRRGEDGDFEQIENVGPKPATATAATASQAAAPGGKPFIDDGPDAGASGRRWGWNPETRLYDRDLGPSPSAQKPPEPSDRVGKPTGNTRTRSENGTTVKETEYLLPDGTKEWRSQTETTQPDRVGKPTGNTRSRTENGQAIKEAEYVLPDGSKEWRSQTAPAEGTTVDLAGAPRLDLSSPERARATYRDLFLFVDRQVREGKLTAEKAKAYLVGPHQAVSDMLAEATEQRQSAEGLRRDQLTERSQDMTQAGNRLQFGQNAAQNAIRTSGDLIKAAEGGESTIVPLMVLQAGMGRAMGGFRESPSVVMPSGLMPRVAEQAGAGFAAPASPETAGQVAPRVLPTPLLPPRPMTDPPVSAAPAGSAPSAAQPAAAPVTNAPAVPVPSGLPARDDWKTPGTGDLSNELGQPGDPIMPRQVLRSGLGIGTRTADDLERELLAEGYSLEEVRAARQRAMARAGLNVAVA